MTASPGSAYRGLRHLCGAQLQAGRLDTAAFERLLHDVGYEQADAAKYAADRLRGGTITLQTLVPLLSHYPKLHGKVKCLALADAEVLSADSDQLRVAYHKHAAGDGRLYVNGLEALLREPDLPLHSLSGQQRIAAAGAAEELMCALTGSNTAVSCGFAEFLELTNDACNLVALAVAQHLRAGKKAMAQAHAQTKAKGKPLMVAGSPSASAIPSPEASPSTLPQRPTDQPSPAVGGIGAKPAPALSPLQRATERTPLQPPEVLSDKPQGTAEQLAPEIKSDAARAPPAAAPRQPEIDGGVAASRPASDAAAGPIKIESGSTDGSVRPPPIVKELSQLSHRMLPTSRPAQLQLGLPIGSAEVTPPPPPAPASSPASTQSHPPPHPSRLHASAGRVPISSGSAESRSQSARPQPHDSPQCHARSLRGSSPPSVARSAHSHGSRDAQFSSPQFAGFGTATGSTESGADALHPQSASSLSAQLPCPKLQREAVPTPSPSPLPLRDAHSRKGSSTPPVSAIARGAEQTLHHITTAHTAGHVAAGAPELPPRLHVPSPIAEGGPVTPGTPRHRDGSTSLPPQPSPSPAAMRFRDPNAGEPEVMKAARGVVPLPAPVAQATPKAPPNALAAADAEASDVKGKPVAAAREGEGEGEGERDAAKRTRMAAEPVAVPVTPQAHAQSQSHATQSHADAHAAAAPKPGLVTSAFQLVVGAVMRGAGMQPKPSPTSPPQPPKTPSAAPASAAP